MSIRVLLAEDSAYQRKIIAEMITSTEEIEVIDIAKNGREAIQKIGKHNPDVILLDLIMPEVDGLSVLKFLSEHYPIPTIVFTGLKLESLDDSVQALLLGAFDFIIKPSGYWTDEFPKFKEKLISSILYAGKIKKTYEKRNMLIKESIESQFNSDIDDNIKVTERTLKPIAFEVPKIVYSDIKKLKSSIIVIGTSTGGPRTLKSILKKIPKDFPSPILMVQHLDAFFMKQLAKSLNDVCELEIKIPVDGEKIQPGKVYLSPGGMHMQVVIRNNRPCIRIFKGEPVNFCMPSVDVLFFSVAKTYKQNSMGILLTGLGDDGAAGLDAIKAAGGDTIAESEETCVVYGMPKAALKRGAAKLVLPNYQIRDYMMKFAKKFTIEFNN
ncbi:MAG: chemotaxis-specific protein-glutamate methyltransferase CheB [Candidatus Thorarchaeota archaeon]